MDIKVNALIIAVEDSVAVAITELKAGDRAAFKVGEEIQTIDIVQDIPIYHKFSMVNVKKDELVYKYGQVIGKATCDIKAGEHVHTHNIVSASESLALAE